MELILTRPASCTDHNNTSPHVRWTKDAESAFFAVTCLYLALWLLYQKASRALQQVHQSLNLNYWIFGKWNLTLYKPCCNRAGSHIRACVRSCVNFSRLHRKNLLGLHKLKIAWDSYIMKYRWLFGANKQTVNIYISNQWEPNSGPHVAASASDAGGATLLASHCIWRVKTHVLLCALYDVHLLFNANNRIVHENSWSKWNRSRFSLAVVTEQAGWSSGK